MKKCRRTIHAALVVGLLVAALPVVAQPSARDGQTAFGIFAKIEAVVVKLWPFSRPERSPTGGGNEFSTHIERVDVIARIGAGASVGGIALPQDASNPPASDEPPSHQGS
jgi:hypothetical protein